MWLSVQTSWFKVAGINIQVFFPGYFLAPEMSDVQQELIQKAPQLSRVTLRSIYFDDVYQAEKIMTYANVIHKLSSTSFPKLHTMEVTAWYPEVAFPEDRQFCLQIKKLGTFECYADTPSELMKSLLNVLKAFPNLEMFRFLVPESINVTKKMQFRLSPSLVEDVHYTKLIEIVVEEGHRSSRDKCFLRAVKAFFLANNIVSQQATFSVDMRYSAPCFV